MEIVRYYFALTNLCNRACELCSCHSDPYHKTNLPFEKFVEIVSSGEEYEAQLEGGEPTIHPDFDKIVSYLISDSLCKKIIVCTNAVLIPIFKEKNKIIKDKSINKIKDWLLKFKQKPFILKPSINSHLIKHSSIHMEKMVLIKKAFDEIDFLPGSQLIYNVRRLPIPITKDGEAWLVEELKEKNIYHLCNDFEYQRYGKGGEEKALALPYIIENPINFFLISPDGKNFGKDLIARANHMGEMS